MVLCVRSIGPNRWARQEGMCTSQWHFAGVPAVAITHSVTPRLLR